MGMFELIVWLLPFGLIGLGYLVGHVREVRHFQSLDERQAELSDILLTDLRQIPAPESVADARMVMGEVVIATDYFKSFASKLRNLVGGEMRSLETLVRRARREALLRMLENARRMGATEVHNIRLETSNVTRRQGKQASFSAEMLAFGTAITRRPG